MKKRFLLLALLLVGCVNTDPNSSNISKIESESIENISSNAESIESDSSLSSFSSIDEKEIKKQQIQTFIKNISTMDGKVQSMDIRSEKVDYYMSDTVPLTIGILDIATHTRYSSQEGDITVVKGHMGFANDEGLVSDYYDYETQTFYDSNYFYRITDYTDPSMTDSKQTIPFSKDYIDTNLNIGFSNTELVNFKNMINMVDNSNFIVDVNNIDASITNGEWKYNYRVAILENGIVSEEVIYENTLQVENGIIKEVNQNYKNNKYAGGIKANWTESNISMKFNQGEKKVFDGVRFDPNAYKEEK